MKFAILSGQGSPYCANITTVYFQNFWLSSDLHHCHPTPAAPCSPPPTLAATVLSVPILSVPELRTSYKQNPIVTA